MKLILKILAYSFLCVGMNGYAITLGTVMVHNMTHQDLVVAPYHVTKKAPHKGTRYADSVAIPAGDKREVSRPSLTFRFDSELFFCARN
jgi:hypothetical protein